MYHLKLYLSFLCMAFFANFAHAQTISGSSTLCVGSTTTYAGTPTGGIWTTSSPAIATIGAITGVATGVSAGMATITYTLPTSASAVFVVSVSAPGTITGATSLCAGSTTTLTGSPAGGTWSSSMPSFGTISAAGVLTGIAHGITTITYTLPTGCISTRLDSVYAVPAPITGSAWVCMPTTTTLTSTTVGGTWSSSTSAVATVAAGVVTGHTAGTATIAYTLYSGCSATHTVTVSSTPTVTATVTAAACGNSYSLVASGATDYVWMSPAGLSCMSCSSPTATPSATTTYTVTGISPGPSGCSSSTIVTVPGNRIFGHISFSGTAPSSPSLKVWLIRFNPSDSSITATDSVTTCMDGTSPYYQFDSKPTGNYLVKAKLAGTTPGTSDYIPTYGASTSNWYSAATVAHAAATDVQNINMIYGTVPAGPGFISGYVYSGAGRGTADGIPVAGMLIFLKNAAGQVLTYTYTSSTGAYSFSSLATGSYTVYPEEHGYYTTPRTAIVLTTASPTVAAASFKQYTTSGVILPYTPSTSIFSTAVQEAGAGIYPNPATGKVYIQTEVQMPGTATIVLADMTGRTVLSTEATLNAKGNAQIDLSSVTAGMYIIRVTSEHLNYTGKLTVQD